MSSGAKAGRGLPAAERLDRHLADRAAQLPLAPGLGLGRAQGAPEGRELAPGREAQALQRAAAGPVDEGLMIRPRRQVMFRNHPLRQVVDLLKGLAPGHGQVAGAPEVLQGGLLRMPVPPATAALLAVLAEVAGHQRAFAGDARQHPLEQALEAGAAELAPALDEACPLALEAWLPEGVKAAGDHRRVVGPVLEERRLALQQMGQLRLAIGLVAAEEDVVVGPLDRVDAVDLDVAQILDQPQ